MGHVIGKQRAQKNYQIIYKRKTTGEFLKGNFTNCPDIFHLEM